MQLARAIKMFYTSFAANIIIPNQTPQQYVNKSTVAISTNGLDES